MPRQGGTGEEAEGAGQGVEEGRRPPSSLTMQRRRQAKSEEPQTGHGYRRFHAIGNRWRTLPAQRVNRQREGPNAKTSKRPPNLYAVPPAPAQREKNRWQEKQHGRQEQAAKRERHQVGWCGSGRTGKRREVRAEGCAIRAFAPRQRRLRATREGRRSSKPPLPSRRRCMCSAAFIPSFRPVPEKA